MSTNKNFLGIAIDGEITNQRKNQRPREEFEAMVKAVLDDPFIDEFGWRQYTPYFNDGDTCIFGARGFWVRTVRPEPVVSEQDTAADRLERARAAGILTDEDVASLRPHIETQPQDGDDDYDEDDYEALAVDRYSQHPTLGGPRDWRDDVYVGEHHESWRRCMELSEAIEGEQFDSVLLEVFGDHAEIKVRRDGITVRLYSHD